MEAERENMRQDIRDKVRKQKFNGSLRYFQLFNLNPINFRVRIQFLIKYKSLLCEYRSRRSLKKKRNAAELNFLLVINEALVTLGPIVHLRRFSGMKRRIEREEKIPSHFLLIILFRSFRTHTSHTPELVTDLLICGNNPELYIYIYIYYM